MKKRFMKWFVMAAMVAVIIPAAGLAQGRRNGINERQRNQQQRIRQGVRSGELTGVASARRRRQEAQIKLNEARARQCGGEFSLQERARIQSQLDRESQNIYQQKHDAQDRNPNNSINERQQNQRERIQQGVRSGELTPVEAARIRRQVAQIRLTGGRGGQSRGAFPTQERARIQRQLNRESRRIYRQKHDAQDRNP